jgi:hypothetical protein
MIPEAQELPLRDIHLPEPISWWPPAPGWWLLLGLLVLSGLVVWFIFYLRKRYALRKAALAELKGICEVYQQRKDSHELVKSISVLLRRVCISQFPRADVAALTGEAWLLFLDSNLSRGRTSREREDNLRFGFSRGPGRCLIESPYRREEAVGVDGPALLLLCRHWIKSLPATVAGGTR